MLCTGLYIPLYTVRHYHDHAYIDIITCAIFCDPCIWLKQVSRCASLTHNIYFWGTLPLKLILERWSCCACGWAYSTTYAQRIATIHLHLLLQYQRLLGINHGVQMFLFDLNLNVLVSSFRFIWIPMLWVYGYFNYFNSFSAGIVFIRQNDLYTSESDV